MNPIAQSATPTHAGSTTTAAPHLPALDSTAEWQHRAVSTFLFREAQWLDEGRFNDWLTLVTDDVRYRLQAPTVTTLLPGGREDGPRALLMDETLGSLKTRVKQLSTPVYTVAENPRSSTCRFITNIWIESVDAQGTFVVCSKALVHRTRGDQMPHHLYAMSRRDTLRSVEGQLRLACRDALLNESVVGARSIAALF